MLRTSHAILVSAWFDCPGAKTASAGSRLPRSHQDDEKVIFTGTKENFSHEPGHSVLYASARLAPGSHAAPCKPLDLRLETTPCTPRQATTNSRLKFPPPLGGARPFRQKSTWLAQFTLGPRVVEDLSWYECNILAPTNGSVTGFWRVFR